MDWATIILIVFVNIIPIQASRHDMNVKGLIDILLRRNYRKSPISLGIPFHPEDLPEAESIHPGSSLIRPTFNMLKSAVKYPQRDLGNSQVYGNLANLGIADEKGHRVKYTNFRKTNDIMDLFRKIINHETKKYADLPVSKRKEKKYTVIIMNPPAASDELYIQHSHRNTLNQLAEEENNATEILDDSQDVSEEDTSEQSFRRRSKKSKSKYRHRKRIYSDSRDSSESSGSSDYEKNPGNPYTLHKNKYKQNWMWNHIMDGDHMNVNPYAPNTPETGPSGADLFFSRKWWYFNQDDYKPLA